MCGATTATRFTIRREQVLYDIDADSYVTGYTYDPFGQQVALTRYADKMTLAQVNAGVPPAAPGRKMTSPTTAAATRPPVEQPSVTYYKALNGTSATDLPAHRFSYDAYGNLTRQSVLIEAGVYADTYNYYDDLGRRTLSVDPEGSSRAGPITHRAK
jgi:YD repeat-containing protein